MSDNWRVWNNDHLVEQRTYKRVTGDLPEMECTKQLVELLKDVYKPGMGVLDVGCAAGHYYNGLTRLDNKINYCGIDATKSYIDFAKKHFSNNPNAAFFEEDIYYLPESYFNAYDIVFCCNVLLHLPSLGVPLKNLINSSRKFCFIRTLISHKTHLSKLLYSDVFDDKGEPTDFVFQNTYSFNIIKKMVSDLGYYRIEFIDDIFNSDIINDEFNQYGAIQSAVTQVSAGLQLAGSKVFEWKWVKISK
jgi:SAM-dependent methyltransferase